MQFYFSNANVQEISEMIFQASASVTYAYATSDNDIISNYTVSPDQIASALGQFVDVMHMVENADSFTDWLAEYTDDSPQGWDASDDMDDEVSLDPNDISEIGNYALDLIDTLSDWARNLKLSQEQQKLQAVMVVIALWIARHGGRLSSIEKVTDTLSTIANNTNEPWALVEMSHVMGELMAAVSTETKRDFQQGIASKVWRTLHVNRGIVATRSHDPQLMESVFDQLVLNIPEAAALFFEEGMQQVIALDYPLVVRDVMNRYYKRYTMRVVH
jgi:hypothetical protein